MLFGNIDYGNDDNENLIISSHLVPMIIGWPTNEKNKRDDVDSKDEQQ